MNGNVYKFKKSKIKINFINNTPRNKWNLVEENWLQNLWTYKGRTDGWTDGGSYIEHVKGY